MRIVYNTARIHIPALRPPVINMLDSLPPDE